MAENSLDDHPLLLEIQSLRAAVAQFQQEAHASALKLQHHSLASTHAHERAAHLERENDALRAEVAVLRANPYPPSSSSSTHHPSPSPLETHSQIQELTLSLRRLSHKLTLTEDALLSRTTALAAAQAEAARAGKLREAAYELGARVRGREEEALGRVGEMEVKIRKLEEELRMADGVIQEYAKLVRRMEGARSSSSSSSFSDAEKEKEKSSHLPLCLHDHKTLLDSLVAQFSTESKDLQSRLHQRTAELEICKAELDVERKTNESVLVELGKEKTELEKLRLEDGTAAKMVARYMQFSQSQSHHHLSSLHTLQTRHSSTVSTLTTSQHLLSSTIRSLERQNATLRQALDELGGEYMKEVWGRRREVAVRLRMGGREERVGEGVRRWVRRGEEWVGRLRPLSDSDESAKPNPYLEALLDLSQHARILLSELDSGILDEQAALSLSSGKARKLVVQMGLDGLLEELRVETGRRVGAERRVAGIREGEVDKSPRLEASSPSELPPTVVVSSGNGDAHPLSPKSDAKVPGTSSVAGEVPSVKGEDVPGAVSGPEARSVPVDDTNTDASGGQNIKSDTPSPSPSTPAPAASPQDENSPIQTPTKDDAPEDLPADTSSTPASVDGDQAPPQTQTQTQQADRADGLIPPPPPPVILVHADEVDSPLVDARTVEPVPDAVDSATTSNTDPRSQSSTTSLPTSDNSNDPQLNSVSFPSSTTSTPTPPSIPPTPPPASPSPPSPPPPPPTLLLSPSPASNEDEPSPTPPPPPQPNPLLASLAHVTKRYDDLQRAFRDCHLALEGLKASLGVGSPNSGSFGSSPYGHQSTSPSSSAGSSGMGMGIPRDVLRAALSRLDDYTEDARVELEIRIGDEALLARGYEALLSVPGALAAASTSPPTPTPTSSSGVAAAAGASSYHNLNLNSNLPGHGDEEQEPTQNDIEAQITAFISGTDPAVRRAKEALERKLADVQHDVAVLKRAVHDPESFDLEGFGEREHEPSSSSGGVYAAASSTSSLSESQGQSTSSGGGGWSSWIRGSASRPASPAPTPQSSTFGAIMTDPRLRHSPSTGSFHSQSQVQNPHQNQAQGQRARKSSFFSFGVGAGGGGASEPVKDPLASLGLKVPMPNFSVLSGAGGGGGGPLSAGLGGTFGIGSGAGPYGGLLPLSPTSPLAPMGAMGPGVGGGGTRSRTVSSTMYMLGLGAAAVGAGGQAGVGRGAMAGRSVSASSGMGMGVGMSRQASTSSTSSLGWGHSRQAEGEEGVGVTEDGEEGEGEEGVEGVEEDVE